MRKTTLIYSIVTLLLFNWGCKKDSTGSIGFNDIKTNNITFHNILILGNSITKHPPLPELGWYGNWGMAASSEDKDYVHVLEKKYKEINPAISITPVSISDWEASHSNYDLNKLDQYFNKIPDIVIIRLGENVKDYNNFGNSLKKLITYIKSKSASTKLIMTGVFWKNKSKENQLESVALENGIPFIKIEHLNTSNNISYIGAEVADTSGKFYKIKNRDVAKHPGDTGMMKLAALIYNELVANKF